MTLLDDAGYIYGAMATNKRIENADSSLLQRVGDLPLRVGIAVNNTVKSFSDFFGADNPVSHILRDNSDWYARLLSAQAVENDKEVARILEDAKDTGAVESLVAGLKAFTVAPADFLASGAGSLLPFLAGGAIAKAGGLGCVGAGVTQASLSSAIQVGAVKGGIYEEIKSELISRGVSEEVAKSEALKAQQYGGSNTDQLVVGGALGILGGRVGAQRAIDGEVSPLRDTMDAVSDKIHRLLGGGQQDKEAGAADIKNTDRPNLSLGRGFSSRSSSSSIDGKGRVQSV